MNNPQLSSEGGSSKIKRDNEEDLLARLDQLSDAEVTSLLNDMLAKEEVFEVPSVDILPSPTTFPLSFAQERLWFLDQLQPGIPLYNIPAAHPSKPRYVPFPGGPSVRESGPQ